MGLLISGCATSSDIESSDSIGAANRKVASNSPTALLVCGWQTIVIGSSIVNDLTDLTCLDVSSDQAVVYGRDNSKGVVWILSRNGDVWLGHDILEDNPQFKMNGCGSNGSPIGARFLSRFMVGQPSGPLKLLLIYDGQGISRGFFLPRDRVLLNPFNAEGTLLLRNGAGKYSPVNFTY